MNLMCIEASCLYQCKYPHRITWGLYYHRSMFFIAFDDITFIRNMTANAINITMATHTPAVR